MASPDIFISYARADSRWFELVAKALQEAGWRVFSDDTDLQAGALWPRAIQNALTGSRGVVLLLSPAAVQSQWVLAEVQMAMQVRKLFVVRIEDIVPDAVPFGLHELHWLDLRGWGGEAADPKFRNLLRMLGNSLGLPAEAPSWLYADEQSGGSSPQPTVAPNRQPLNEGKLILVGFGGVGKTTLVNRIVLGRPFNKDETKTDGIRISDWHLDLHAGVVPAKASPSRGLGILRSMLGRNPADPPKPGPDTLCMHVWDFGGQEIMHATHQFFLSVRALYLLVLSGREGREDADAEYWLDMIATFGADSPVVVVLNKIRQMPFDVNRRALQGKHPNIRAFVETDCEDDTGIPALAAVVRAEIDRMPHLRDTFPTHWFQVKDRLARMREDFLSFDEFRRICDGAGESDPASQETLANFLHTLGVALNFRDDPRLRDLHVLKPAWVTEGIYSILNNKALARGRGELTLPQLREVLDASRYPERRHPYLFELMRKFELCFRFPDDEERFLVPELLDKQEPVLEGWAEEEALAFEYHYATIVPEGLIPRFIVRTSALSTGQARWRSGVVLQFRDNAAVATADPQARLVRIRVRGPQPGRRTLLAVMRSDFEHIHRSYGIQPREMAPIPGHPGALVSYDKLLVLEKNRVPTMQEVWGEQILQLDVKALLDGVDLEGVRPARAEPERRQVVIEAFVSYSHRDEGLRAELDTYLKLLHRQGLLASWSDRCITAGDDWKGQIDAALERAHLVLLLVSADFLASDYCMDVEMGRALERAHLGQTVLVPIIVRTCPWESFPFSRWEALPMKGKPVTASPSRSAKDKAWTQVADGIAAKARALAARA